MKILQRRANIRFIVTHAILSCICCVVSYSVDFFGSKAAFFLSIVVALGLYSIHAFGSMSYSLAGISISIVLSMLASQFISA